MLGSQNPQNVIQFATTLKSRQISMSQAESLSAQSQLGSLLSQLAVFGTIHFQKVTM